jgi:hypothetical protein
MPRITYTPKNFRAVAQSVIQTADEVCTDYARRGFDLTLRQLYYQFVAHDHFPDTRWFWWNDVRRKWIADPEHQNAASTKNAEPNYKWLGELVNDARLAGLIDWNHLEDRTRSLYGLRTYDDPGHLLRLNQYTFRTDLWANQPYHVEVWVEKQALESVIARAANQRQADYFSCRGYVSQSAMWEAAQRLRQKTSEGKKNVIIHLGDHDPSGIDMTRDIEDRLELFDAVATVDRIALNMDQVREYDPPPNPAKLTDSRVDGYMERFGESSWELDALPPEVLNQLILDAIDGYRNGDTWDADAELMETQRAELEAVADNWPAVAQFLRDSGEL